VIAKNEKTEQKPAPEPEQFDNKSFSEPKKKLQGFGGSNDSNDRRKSGGNTPFRRVNPEAVDENYKISNRFTDWVIILRLFSRFCLRRMKTTKRRRMREMRRRSLLAPVSVGRTGPKMASLAGTAVVVAAAAAARGADAAEVTAAAVSAAVAATAAVSAVGAVTVAAFADAVAADLGAGGTGTARDSAEATAAAAVETGAVDSAGAAAVTAVADSADAVTGSAGAEEIAAVSVAAGAAKDSAGDVAVSTRVSATTASKLPRTRRCRSGTTSRQGSRNDICTSTTLFFFHPLHTSSALTFLSLPCSHPTPQSPISSHAGWRAALTC
jgi:hypothetical protein